MPKQVLADALRQARQLAREAGQEVLKEPGRLVEQAARTTAILPPEDKSAATPSATPAINTDAELANARNKLQSFAKQQSSQWRQAELRAQSVNQKRIKQIVESQLTIAPEPPTNTLAPAQPPEKKNGLLGGLRDFFKSKKPRSKGMAAVGHAQKQASGEFHRDQQ